MADPPRFRGEGTPRWVKVSAIIGGVVLVIMVLSGHGPWRHIPASGTSPASIIDGAAGNGSPRQGGL